MCRNCLFENEDMIWIPRSPMSEFGRSRRFSTRSALTRKVKKAQTLNRFDKTPAPEYVDGQSYTQRELEAMADAMLRADAKSVDPTTGKERGINGKDPILFAEHEYARKRREIYTEVGTPDPSLVQGIYNRTHPQGRKVNSEEARKKHGASWYR